MPQPAFATRTAIDSIPGAPFQETFNGYCDYDGSNCTKMNIGGSGGAGYLLPFSVSFDGGATFTDTMFVRGDGRLSFGGTGDYYSYIAGSYKPGSGVPGQVAHNAGTPSLATVQVGINSRLTNDLYTTLEPNVPEYARPLIYDQSARVDTLASSLTVHFFTCSTPPCALSSHNRYDLTLSQVSGGLQVDATYFGGSERLFAGQSAGWTLGAGTSGSTAITGSTLSFLLPAAFPGAANVVPEPATWLMMILGFGLTGTALRRRSAAASAIAHA